VCEGVRRESDDDDEGDGDADDFARLFEYACELVSVCVLGYCV
jgi:hypothetical protein